MLCVYVMYVDMCIYIYIYIYTWTNGHLALLLPGVLGTCLRRLLFSLLKLTTSIAETFGDDESTPASRLSLARPRLNGYLDQRVLSPSPASSFRDMFEEAVVCLTKVDNKYCELRRRRIHSGLQVPLSWALLLPAVLGRVTFLSSGASRVQSELRL